MPRRLVRKLAGIWVPDTVSGFRAFGREAAIRLNIVSSFSYTVETVMRYRERFPGAVLYFLLGSDSFSQISTWERWKELVDLAHLVVLHRAHIWGSELRQRVPEPLRSRLVEVEPFAKVSDPTEQTVYLLNHDPFPVSATDVRQRQRQGFPIRELVPHEVNSYIEKYRLYRTENDEE